MFVCKLPQRLVGRHRPPTLLRHFGISAEESEIARETLTYAAGTESWFLARALRKRGLQVKFQIYRDGLPEQIPYPSIAGVRIGAIGHFITILEDNGTTLIIGEPLRGRYEIEKAEIFRDEDYFTGFFMKVSALGNEHDLPIQSSDQPG